jgi:glucokinase
VSGGRWFGAVDIGGTKIAVGIADADGQLVASDTFPTLPDRGPEVVLGETAARLRGLALGRGVAFEAVGVGCVGPLDPRIGTLMNPPNFPGWSYVPVKAHLERALGARVTIDNDANVAALAEYRHGAGRGARVMVYATVSTGVGGGIVLDGRLLHGIGGGAGEFGHQTVRPDGPLCGCGNRGCLESLASGTAIARRAREAVAAGGARGVLAAAGGDPGAIHAGHVAQAAREGDPDAQAIWDAAMGDLAIGLGNVVTTLAPDRLVIGGGVTRAGEQLLGPVKAGLARHVRMVPVNELEVRLASLADDVGLVGAAALVAGPA